MGSSKSKSKEPEGGNRDQGRARDELHTVATRVKRAEEVMKQMEEKKKELKELEDDIEKKEKSLRSKNRNCKGYQKRKDRNL